MVARSYWLAGTFTVLTLGGCGGGVRHPQHATLLPNLNQIVPSTSLPSFSLPKISLPSLHALSFPAREPHKEVETEEANLPVILSQDQEKIQMGMASWYGPGFHGRRTANGEVYNQHALTAAHPTLPLGTRAVVTNVDTGDSVEVRINDRGPYKYGRVIDLSYEAARRIGIWTAGTARVRVEVLNADGTLPPEPTIVPSAYAVLLASSPDAEEIAILMGDMGRQQPDVYISSLSSGMLRYYQLRLGPFRSRRQAITRAQELKNMGFQALVVAEDDLRAER